MLTQEELKSALNYDQETGSFTWIRPISKKIRAGSVAGCMNADGYIVIRLFGTLYFAHRLAYLYMKGDWPRDKIDHKNIIRNDNRWRNLREADDFLNNQNQQKARKTSLTGLLGVSPHGARFRARIRMHGKYVLLGVFDTPELAHAAYLESKRANQPGCLI